MNDESPQSLMTEETTKALASLFTASSEKQIGQLETLLQELGWELEHVSCCITLTSFEDLLKMS